MDDELKLINQLLECDKQEQNEVLNREPTVFKILGRTYDEDLISRMLAYVLKTDANIVKKLFHFYFCGKPTQIANRYSQITVECEKTMINGRADIFITAKGDDGKRYTLTIENKIFSWEHDNQTKTYFKFVNSHYDPQKYENSYLFLKPRFNNSPCSCDMFKVIYYDWLYELIGNSQNSIINDFKKHIKDNLTMKKVDVTNTDTKVLSNLEKLRAMLNEAANKFHTIKDSIFQTLATKNTIEGLDCDPYAKNPEAVERYLKMPNGTLSSEVEDAKRSFRIFRKNVWYTENLNVHDAEKYYFYVEIYFPNDDPNEILFQKVVRCKSKQCAVRDFIDWYKRGDGCEENCLNWFGNCFVFSKTRYQSNKALLSTEWIEDFESTAVETLSQHIKEMDLIFKLFQDWNSGRKN